VPGKAQHNKERPMSKLGVHALVWVGGWSESECTKAIHSTAELGYDFIEIPLLNPYGFPVDFTRNRLEEHRLGATASLGLSDDTDISSEDPERVARGEDLLNTAVSVVRDLGATHFCGVIYSALKKYMHPRTEHGVDNIVAVLSRVAAKAHAAGITVGVEVVNRYETNVVNTAAEVVPLLDRIGLPNVYAHLDTYHMNIEEGFVSQAIEQCGPRLGYFHVGESHRGYLGTGTVDFTAVFRSLARIRYDGPIAFESFSSAVVDPVLSNMLGVWRNLWSDGYDLARHAKAYMEAQRHAAAHAVSAQPRASDAPPHVTAAGLRVGAT
jgi:D-psicose/D-tagatose/L-ribulose 3-epimerase